ncbi:hypothetical protein Avbf_02647, partial [Armadillidium vulgare]
MESFVVHDEINLWMLELLFTHEKRNYLITYFYGVKTMAIEWNLHVLAAVSGDGLVKVWNPFVPSKPLLKIPPSVSLAILHFLVIKL